MANLFRSKDMTYVQVTMVNEAAQAVVRKVGDFGKLHLTDLSERDHPSAQFTNHKKRVQQCAYWLKKLQSFRQVIERYEVPMPKGGEIGDMKDSGDKLMQVKDYLEPIEQELTMNIRYVEQAEKHINDQLEYRCVLQVCNDLNLGDDSQDSQGFRQRSLSVEGKAPLLPSKYDIELLEPTERGLIAGVISQNKKISFHRMIYRVSKGANTYVQFIPIESPFSDAEGEEVYKSVFYIKTVGSHLTRKVLHMCKVFGASTFSLPKSSEYSEKLVELQRDVNDKERVRDLTRNKIIDILSKLAGDERGVEESPLLRWEKAIAIEQMTCQALMQCQFHITMMNLEGWCPTENLEELRIVLAGAVRGTGLERPVLTTEMDGVTPPYGATRPTYFPKNKFTTPFQQIVDTYGVPRYHEVNPGLFTCVSFPFLFGVMYGDIFHGFCVFLYGLYLLWNEDKIIAKIKNGEVSDMFQGLFAGRYCLALMGFFGFYCGWIYNDFAANTIPLFESGWDPVEENNTHVPNGLVYPFGIDHQWAHHQSSLVFTNSLKMKMAVTIGVIHMTFGIVLSLFNHIRFKDTAIHIAFEFVPRLVFMLFTMGYMVFLIFYKFMKPWEVGGVIPHPTDPEQDWLAPNLIQVMIKMFLSPTNLPPENRLFEDADTQQRLQLFLLIIALLMVPLMLFGVPVAKRYGSSCHSNSIYGSLNGQSSATDEEWGGAVSPQDGLIDGHMGSDSFGAAGHADHEEHSFGDEMIHNGIHTIEFVLGTVSNTASYLRLWALSLAHAQLAEVFWRMTIMQYGLMSTLLPPSIMVFIGVAAWMSFTFLVLLTMDVLECFLHALRLHWVEFQNKFYLADGIAFEPFAFSPEKIY